MHYFEYLAGLLKEKTPDDATVIDGIVARMLEEVRKNPPVTTQFGADGLRVVLANHGAAYVLGFPLEMPDDNRSLSISVTRPTPLGNDGRKEISIHGAKPKS